MSTFVTKDDYKDQMRTYRLDQILEAAEEDEEVILDTAENEAISLVKDTLATRYDVSSIFGAVGNARHLTVLRWVKVLVIYIIYERIPDEQVPARVVKNYDDVLKWMEAVESGEKNIDGLPPLTTGDGNGGTQPVTRRRWGSVPRRSNDGGSPRTRYW
jgi:hypothetical protein